MRLMVEIEIKIEPGPGPGQVVFAFLRDLQPYAERCLVFGDLLKGPARNWCSQPN